MPEAVEAPEVPEGEEAPEVPEEDDDPEIDLGDIKVKKSELKAGYMKDADYRRKTSEAAEVKRAAQAEREQVKAERAQYANHLDVVLTGLQTQLIGDQQALARLAETDPAEWVKQNAAFQQRYAHYQQAVAERESLANRMTAEQEREMDEWRKAEREKLREKLPEWNDSGKARAEQKMVAEYLISQGYQPEELAELFDHRALMTALDAAKWRAHQSALKAAKGKQTNTPPSPVKPGVAKGNSNQQANPDALRSLQKRGDVDSAMAFLASRRQK